MLQPLVDRIAHWLTHYPWRALLVVLALIGVALTGIWGIRFSTDLFAMAPPEARIVHTFREVSERFGSSLFVVVHADGEKPTDLVVATEKVAAELEASQLFSQVRWQVTREEVSQVRELLRSHLFVYRSLDEEPRLAELLDPEALRKRLTQVKGLLLTPFTPQAAVIKAADPLQLDKMTLRSGSSLSLKPGPLISSDGSTALIITEPRSYSANLDYSRELIKYMRELDTRMTSNPEHPARVEAFGAHITAFQYGGQLQNDLIPSIVSSVVGVTLVFFLLYRSISIALFTAAALGSGVILSLGVMSQLVGQLSPFTIGISALLAGTGIDHSVHLFNRYLEERKAGTARPVQGAIKAIGVGILMAAGTNAFAFLPMLLSRFAGIQDFGIAGASGVPILLLTTLLVVPSLMQIKQDRNPSRGRTFDIHLFTVNRRSASWILAATVLACLVLAPLAFRIKFDMNINSFRVPDPAYEASRDLYMGKFGLTGKTSVLWTIEGTTLEQVLDLNDKITDVAQAHVGTHKDLNNIDSLSLLLPGPARQQERLAQLDPARVEAALTALNDGCEAEGLTDAVCGPSRKILEAAKARGLVSYEELMSAGMGDLLKPYLAQSEGGWLLVGRMWPGEHVDDGSIPETLARRIEALGPGITVAGPVRSNEELREFFHSDLARVCALAAVGILVMLLIQYARQPRHLMLCLLPVSVGLLVFMGLASLLGYKMGLLSLVTLPLVVGTSVDSAVHLTHHLDTDEHFTVQDILSSTGRAVLVCSLSNAVGCASNALTSNPQVREMGILSAMGVLCCLVASLAVWPALAVLFFPHREKGGRIHRPEDDEIEEPQAGV